MHYGFLELFASSPCVIWWRQPTAHTWKRPAADDRLVYWRSTHKRLNGSTNSPNTHINCVCVRFSLSPSYPNHRQTQPSQDQPHVRAHWRENMRAPKWKCFSSERARDDTFLFKWKKMCALRKTLNVCVCVCVVKIFIGCARYCPHPQALYT